MIDEDKPKRLTLKENTARHRKEHPNDILSFSEGKIEDEYSGIFSSVTHYGTLHVPSKKELKPKRKKKMLSLIEKHNREELTLFSRRELLLLGHEWLRMFRHNSEIEAPDMPIDNSGEVIDYPAGRGRGKTAIAEWLCKYESHYNELQMKADLDERIEQTLLG